MLDLDTLKAAYAQSTFGEWFPIYMTGEDGDRRLAGVGVTDEMTGMIDSIFSVADRWDETMDADCAFVSLVNNQFPKLVAEVERLQRIEAAARAMLELWDDHGSAERATLRRLLDEGEATNGDDHQS